MSIDRLVLLSVTREYHPKLFEFLDLLQSNAAYTDLGL